MEKIGDNRLWMSKTRRLFAKGFIGFLRSLVEVICKDKKINLLRRRSECGRYRKVDAFVVKKPVQSQLDGRLITCG